MLHQSNLSYNSLLSHQTVLILRVTMSYSTSATKTISQQHLCKLYLPNSICSVLYSNRILLEFNFPASLTVRWRYISKVFISEIRADEISIIQHLCPLLKVIASFPFSSILPSLLVQEWLQPVGLLIQTQKGEPHLKSSETQIPSKINLIFLSLPSQVYFYFQF